MAGAVMSHCPASGIAPCPDGVKNPSDASARGRTRSLSCSPSNLRGRQGGQPACRSHIASWSMTPHAHCSQQQAVAARPTTRSSSLFPPLHALLALGNVCDTLNKCDGVQGTVILGTKPLATNLSFIVSQALRFLPQDSSILATRGNLQLRKLDDRGQDFAAAVGSENGALSAAAAAQRRASSG